MQLEIKCPECGQQSQTAWDRVPKGKLKTTCHGCRHQFTLNKDTGFNCMVVRDQEGKVYADNGWKVEHPACEGLEYDLEGVVGLVRSGMVGADSRISPPGEQGFTTVKEVAQLQKALEQWEAKNARSGR